MGVAISVKEVRLEKETDDCDCMCDGGGLHGVSFLFALQVCTARGGSEEVA